MDDTIRGLYEVIQSRKESGEEGSYTAYLFDQGLDKILKKVGEESAEVIIAAKNLEQSKDADPALRNEVKNEICDLLYHLLVLMAEQNIGVNEVEEILEDRRQKSGNLKAQKIVDKNT